MAGIGQAASIADVQALEDLLDGLDDLTRASVERALEYREESSEHHDECIDADDHELVVEERNTLLAANLVLTGDLKVANEIIAQLQDELQKLRAA